MSSFPNTSAIVNWLRSSAGSLLSLLVLSCAATLVLVILSSVWAGAEADSFAIERQQKLVDSRLSDLMRRAERDIYLMSTAYSSLLQDGQADKPHTTTKEPKTDPRSQQTNLQNDVFGEIFTSVFGYNEVYLVTADGELFVRGDGASVQRYNWLRPLLLQIVEAARTETARVSISDDRRVGWHSHDINKVAHIALTRLEGRPSIVGAIPLEGSSAALSEGGRIPDDRIFLIAVRFLDGAILDTISQEQGLNGARYARTADPDDNEVVFPIEATASREPIGFIIWKPELPGSHVVSRLVPALSSAALVVAALFFALILRLRRSLKQLHASEQHARHVSLHDVLTGLPNRALLNQRFVESANMLRQGGRRTAVALIDLDRFKSVNDTLGHKAGDELLQLAVERIRSRMRTGDTLARIGGDEFALLLPEMIGGDRDPPLFCKQIVDDLSKAFALRSTQATVHIGCSIGLAILDNRSQTAAEVLQHADLALYKAKASGRGCCIAYDASMSQDSWQRELLKSDLRKALATKTHRSDGQAEHGLLEVHYQPIHSSAPGAAISGAEALVRWNHGRLGLLAPDKFIDLAEEAGLIVQLGNYVLMEACRTAVSWPSKASIAVNISPTQLQRDDFEESVLSALRATGLSAHRLELELTETALFSLDPRGKAALDRLREKGIRIALDDFGTGFSSLSHLLQYGVDRVKIDRSFVGLLGTEAKGATIVQAVVGLSRDLGMATTAEGVETQGQRDFLAAVGCDVLQGYLFSRPLPANAFMSYLTGGLGASQN